MTDERDYTGSTWDFDEHTELLWQVPRNLPYGSGPPNRRCLRLATEHDPTFGDIAYYVLVDSLRFERELLVLRYGYDLFASKQEALAVMAQRTQALADEATRQADKLRKAAEATE